MNLTRIDGAGNITWAEYETNGFDNHGDCKIFVNYYYIPQTGLIGANEDCAVPRNILTVPVVSQLAFPRNIAGGAISSYCHVIGPFGTPIPQAPLNHLYRLKFGNQSYPIMYGFLDNGTVENIVAYPSNKSVIVTIKDYYDNASKEERLFSIQFPRSIFNANVTWTPSMSYTGCAKQAPGDQGWNAGGNDVPFTVVMKNNASYLGPNVGGETCARYSRVVSTSYPSGLDEIQIIGTNMVPEFGPNSLLAIGLAGVLAAAEVIGRGMRSSKLGR